MPNAVDALDLKANLNLTSMSDRELSDSQAACTSKARSLLTLKGQNGETRSLTDADINDASAYTERAEQIAQVINQRRMQTNLSSRLDLINAGGRIIPHDGQRQDDIVNNPDSRKYSLLRAISRRANQQTLDGYEAEISQEISQRLGRQPNGFFMPLSLSVRLTPRQGEQRADFTLSTGAGIIPTFHDSTMIDFLRARRIMAAWGANVLDDLVGKIELPKKTATSSAYWVSGATAVTQTSPEVGTVPLVGNTCGASTLIHRSVLQQSSFAVENMVRMDLVDTVGLEIDRVGLVGSGSGAEPAGLSTTSSIPQVTMGTNGGAVLRSHILDMESRVETANADFGNLKYVTSPAGKAILKSTPVIPDSTFPTYMWSDNNVINGYTGLTTSLIPKNVTKGSGTNLTHIFFGNGNDIVIGFWGAADILVDPFSNSKAGALNVTVLQDADIAFRRLESFVRLLDMNTLAT